MYKVVLCYIVLVTLPLTETCLQQSTFLCRSLSKKSCVTKFRREEERTSSTVSSLSFGMMSKRIILLLVLVAQQGTMGAWRPFPVGVFDISINWILFKNIDIYKGRMALPKRMNFRKNSKRPLTPPLIFEKSCCIFFPEYMTEEPLIMAKICNTNFGIENDHPPLWKLFRKFIRVGVVRFPNHYFW